MDLNPPKQRNGLNIAHYNAIAGAKEFERLNAAIEAGHVLGKVVLQVSPAPL